MKRIDWTPVILAMPYKTNRELVDEFGYSNSAICRKRREMGIPTVRKWDRYKHLLGVEPDAEIAKKMGITANAVTIKRMRDGIPAPLLHRKEAQLQKSFVETLEDYEEYVKTDYGIIDILTDDCIYECKYDLDITDSQRAIGQLILYSEAYPSRYKAIVASRISVNDKVLTVVERLGIRVIKYDIRHID